MQEREREFNKALVAYLGAEAAVGEKKGLGCLLPCPASVLQESPRSARTLGLLGARHWLDVGAIGTSARSLRAGLLGSRERVMAVQQRDGHRQRGNQERCLMEALKQ